MGIDSIDRFRLTVESIDLFSREVESMEYGVKLVLID